MKKKLMEGRTKIVYETDSDDTLVFKFKDDLVSYDGEVKETIKEKGAANAQLSAQIFRLLDSYHIPVHFLDLQSKNEILVKKCNMIPLEIVLRNVATGNFTRRTDFKEGDTLEPPVVEYYIKSEGKRPQLAEESDVLKDELISRADHQQVRRFLTKMNVVLIDFFKRRNLELVSLRIEVGKAQGKLMFCDEFSLDTCGVWSLDEKEKYDLSRLLRNPERAEEAYDLLQTQINFAG